MLFRLLEVEHSDLQRQARINWGIEALQTLVFVSGSWCFCLDSRLWGKPMQLRLLNSHWASVSQSSVKPVLAGLDDVIICNSVVAEHLQSMQGIQTEPRAPGLKL